MDKEYCKKIHNSWMNKMDFVTKVLSECVKIPNHKVELGILLSDSSRLGLSILQETNGR